MKFIFSTVRLYCFHFYLQDSLLDDLRFVILKPQGAKFWDYKYSAPTAKAERVGRKHRHEQKQNVPCKGPLKENMAHS